MMRRFARPYARAIVDVAGSAQKAQELRNELDRFEAARASAADLQELYANPGIDLDSKIKVTTAIAAKLGLADLTRKVLEVLIRNGRINDLAAVSEAVTALVNEELGVAIAEVRTAHPLSAAETDELKSTLEKKVGKKVDVRLSTDPSLIAGFVAKIGSEIWDASVTGKIHKFRASLA